MIQTRLLNLCFTNSIHLSKFELLVATAVNYFVDWNCDICVIEVGVGGLRDATNVFNTPLICVFTKISLDHQEILGDTLELIAIEKSGIIKQGCQVISCFQDSKVLGVLKEECMKLNCALIVDNEQGD